MPEQLSASLHWLARPCRVARCYLPPLMLFWATLPAAAVDRYVDNVSGDDRVGTGSSTAPYKTITKALDVAAAGDTIFARPGLYNVMNGERFPLRMKSKVRLEGVAVRPGGRGVRGPDGRSYTLPVIHGGKATAIDAAGTRRYVSILSEGPATVARLVIFTSNSRAGASDGVGVLGFGRERLVIEGNEFRGDGHAGVTFVRALAGGAGRSAPEVSKNKFTSADLAWGVTAHGDAAPAIRDNQFRCANGIDITEDSRAEVRGNQFTCTSTGLRVQNTTEPTIDGNHIEGCGGNGVVVNDEARPLLKNNTIADNGSGGLAGGVYVAHTASPDLGGGKRGSPGGNVFRNNRDWDVVNRSSRDVSALHNTWTHAGAAIDREDVYDDDEDPMSGRVIYVALRKAK